MSNRRILVVDDDRDMRESIVEVISRMDCDVVGATCGDEALELFQPGAFAMIVSDIKMPGMTGIELLKKIKHIDPDVPFVIMTAFGAVDLAVEAMREGAHDFIQKSENLIDMVEQNVIRTLNFSTLLSENKRLKSALKERWDYIGRNSKISEMRELVETVAQSRSTVLVCGESGTGKELIARSIHYLSPRQGGPFVKVNCAALPEGLIESELFGHEKGSFTGAMKNRVGKFEHASGGTLLLDEIGEMPANVQAKLLRVLQEHEISKVGGDDPIEVDVRIVATTNRNLEEEIQNGNFREDLYYRLNVFHFELPSLRERMDDIEELASHFIDKYNKENGFNVEGLEPASLDILRNYSWPGNIRELENTIERAVVLARTGFIRAQHLQLKAAAGKAEGLHAGMTIAQAEKELIFQTLEFCEQNRTKAAQMLDISIRTLRNKLNEYSDSTPA